MRDQRELCGARERERGGVKGKKSQCWWNGAKINRFNKTIISPDIGIMYGGEQFVRSEGRKLDNLPIRATDVLIRHGFQSVRAVGTQFILSGGRADTQQRRSIEIDVCVIQYSV